MVFKWAFEVTENIKEVRVHKKASSKYRNSYQLTFRKLQS